MPSRRDKMIKRIRRKLKGELSQKEREELLRELARLQGK